MTRMTRRRVPRSNLTLARLLWYWTLALLFAMWLAFWIQRLAEFEPGGRAKPEPTRSHLPSTHQ